MRPRSSRLHSPDELRDAFEAYLAALPLAAELGRLEEALRYALESGGKRVRPVLCLAVAEAAGGTIEACAPRRGRDRARAHVLARPRRPARRSTTTPSGGGVRAPTSRSAKGVALLAGDALLARGIPARAHVREPEPARELVEATLGMIGGQYRDITGRRRGPRRAPPAEDGAAVLGLGRARPLGGRSRPIDEQARVARVRRRARPALPGRRRHPRRRRRRCARWGSRGLAGSPTGRRERARARLAAIDADARSAARARRRSGCNEPVEGSTTAGFLATIRRSRTGQGCARRTRIAARPVVLSPRCRPASALLHALCARRGRRRGRDRERHAVTGDCGSWPPRLPSRPSLEPPRRGLRAPKPDARRAGRAVAVARGRRAVSLGRRVALPAASTARGSSAGRTAGSASTSRTTRTRSTPPAAACADRHLKPGDVLFFYGLGHVGMYLGERQDGARAAHGQGRRGGQRSPGLATGNDVAARRVVRACRSSSPSCSRARRRSLAPLPAKMLREEAARRAARRARAGGDAAARRRRSSSPGSSSATTSRASRSTRTSSSTSSSRRGSCRAAARSSRTRSTRSASTSRGTRLRDVGASTGGFTDCLLQAGRGARRRDRRRLRPAPSAAARRSARDRPRAHERARRSRAAVLPGARRLRRLVHQRDEGAAARARARRSRAGRRSCS